MSAILSEDGKYRYSLSRDSDLFGGDKRGLLFLMLNPSTADAELDDNTIKRCKSFSSKFGYGGFKVGNLYALRATDPNELWRSDDPIGPENDKFLMEMADEAEIIICAWGDNADVGRVKSVCDLLGKNAHKFRCLHINSSGMPRHPLYTSGDSRLLDWSVDLIDVD